MNKYYLDYLQVIGSIHRMKYHTFKLLANIHETYFKLPPEIETSLDTSQRQLIRYNKLLIHMQIIEAVCQYIELLGSYSFANMKTGILYPQLVFSIGTQDINKFYRQIKGLRDEDVSIIFNPKHKLSQDVLDDIKKRYSRVADFRVRYWSLYNAIKHGMRVYPLEFERKDGEGKLTGEIYCDLQWVKVQKDFEDKEQTKAHTWDGREVTLPVKKRKGKGMLLPIDLSEYQVIADDCFYIVDCIIKRNTPVNGQTRKTS